MTSSTHLSRAVRAAIAAVIGTVLLWATPPAHAADGGKDNKAIAVNRKDNSSEVRASFQITDLKGDVIDPTNTAFAFASCSNCNTYAVAIQVALLHGTPQVFTPLNQAWAFNYLCNSCTTIADAYQFVTTVPEDAVFTKEGDKQLKDLRKQVGDLKQADLSPFELHDAVGQIVSDVRDVLATGIEHTGDIDDERVDGRLEDRTTSPDAPSPDEVGTSAETSPADVPFA
jgi:putative peptide zinc metalloprotease protein